VLAIAPREARLPARTFVVQFPAVSAAGSELSEHVEHLAATVVRFQETLKQMEHSPSQSGAAPAFETG
jgi:hypothetical protein